MYRHDPGTVALYVYVAWVTSRDRIVNIKVFRGLLSIASVCHSVWSLSIYSCVYPLSLFFCALLSSRGQWLPSVRGPQCYLPSLCSWPCVWVYLPPLSTNTHQRYIHTYASPTSTRHPHLTIQAEIFINSVLIRLSGRIFAATCKYMLSSGAIRCEAMQRCSTHLRPWILHRVHRLSFEDITPILLQYHFS